ncbi:MAG: hypothetical protein ABIK12_09355 [Pseudomonadota bacterium]
MPEQLSPVDPQYKTLLRSSLAVSAPAIVVFTILISANAVDILQSAHLGRMGVAAAGVLAIGLGFLLWRGRWWAGLPTMAASALAAIFFAYKFARPMAAYISANPVNSLGDVFHPLLILSPSLVVVVICVALTMATFKGVRLARELGPRPVSKKAWILLGLWLVLLGGDYAYQQAGWRLFKSPGDLVVRLCQPKVHDEARNLLLAQGVKAVPFLLQGMAASDSDLQCLRKGSLEVLSAMGPVAILPLLEAAKDGSMQALVALQAINDPRAADPLLNIYRTPKPKRDPEFQLQLRQTIKKLNPALNLDG